MVRTRASAERTEKELSGGLELAADELRASIARAQCPVRVAVPYCPTLPLAYCRSCSDLDSTLRQTFGYQNSKSKNECLIYN